MKMRYTKTTWTCASVTDLMAPVAKFQISGSKVVFAVPFQSLSASMVATSESTAPTIGALSQHMMSMDGDTFHAAGGVCVCLTQGDFLWLRECCVVAEFNIGEPESRNIYQSLTWVALTEYHCSAESCRFSGAYVKSVLNKCCEPSQKHLETQLKARLHILGGDENEDVSFPYNSHH